MKAQGVAPFSWRVGAAAARWHGLEDDRRMSGRFLDFSQAARPRLCRTNTQTLAAHLPKVTIQGDGCGVSFVSVRVQKLSIWREIAPSSRYDPAGL
jgi:hypothetical protein